MGVPTASVQVENVCKRWGATTALQDVSFTAAAGSLTVLLGSSGCGKSTLLRLVAGLDGVSAGHIRIDGRDVTGEPPSRRRISMVFQNYALFPHLSVGENILFGLRVRKASRADCDARLARVAGLLGLGALLDRRPAQLSGGQQQRVAMGRAIIAEQPVCLMDEPMSNLDAQLRAEMRVEIQSLQKRLGITMLYVTHDQVEAMSMADQVVLLNAGRVEQVAPPAEMYAAPGTVFAARFIGTPPASWDELVAAGQKTTVRDAAGNVTQWGLMIPSGVTSHWFYQGLATPNGVRPMNDAGTVTDLATPASIEALQFLGDLSHKFRIMPEGVIDTGTSPSDFIGGRTAMMFHSTGNLSNVKANATFPFGVAMLPAKLQRGSPTGGGSMYIFKHSSPEELDATMKFVVWMTSADQAARWSIGTGYVAPRQDAWDVAAMRTYAAGFAPALVAREQLQYSVAEFSTHDGSRTTKALEDAIESVVTGTATAQAALQKAQADCERILRPFRR